MMVIWAGLLAAPQPAVGSQVEAAPSGGETLPAAGEILAVGSGRIVAGNAAAAKQQAVSEALAKGVESFLLQRLGPQAATEHFQRLLEGVLPQAEQNAENYHILGTEERAGRVHVLLRLRVNEKLLEDRLRAGGIGRREETPAIKILILVSEVTPEGPRYWWRDPEAQAPLGAPELALTRAFQRRGLHPVSRAFTPPQAERLAPLSSAEPGPEEAREWGRCYGADAVVYGRAENPSARQAGIALKVLQVASGAESCRGGWVEELGTQGAPADRLTAALDRLAERAAESCLPEMIRAVLASGLGVETLTVTLKRLGSYRQVRVFRDFLASEVKGVRAVRQTRVSRDSVSFEVDFQGPADTLSGRVLQHAALPFSLMLEASEGDQIIFATR